MAEALAAPLSLIWTGDEGALDVVGVWPENGDDGGPVSLATLPETPDLLIRPIVRDGTVIGAIGAILARLSPRERQVLELMARGLSNAAICRELHLSIKTVEAGAAAGGALTETVERVAASQDLTGPIDTRGRDELGRLARSFATMMAALHRSVAAQRRLVADASHELRTPLTSLTTNLDLLAEMPSGPDAQAPVLVREARAQVGELTVLVNELVDLARDGQTEAHVEDIRLDLLVERLVARARRRVPGLEMEARLAPGMVRADLEAVERAVGNLLDNAVKGARPVAGWR